MRLRSPVAVAPLVISLCIVAVTRDAAAQASLLTGFGGPINYGTSCLSPNDDGSSSEIDLTPAFPNGLHFFSGTALTSVYVNTNGNITFNQPESTFSPTAFPLMASSGVIPQPMIAPYWADVDIRAPMCGLPDGTGSSGSLACQNPTTNGVWWYLDPTPPGRFIVTWDHVGYYNCQDDKVMAFQLILTGVTTCGGAMANDDFDIEFRYNVCGWEAGSATNGIGGFCTGSPAVCSMTQSAGEDDCCAPAQVGFDSGDGVDYTAVLGSRTQGISTQMCTMSNLNPQQRGVWQFQVRGGAVMQCPGAGTACSTSMPGICAQGAMQCPNGATTATCLPFTSPQAQQCNGLDNDCDGVIDTGPCPAGEICNGSMCVPMCVEGSCYAGQVCTGTGVCVDAACANVTCMAGERCVAGNCVDACNGVVCPTGQVCRNGACVDPCAGFSCGPNAYCVEANGQATCVGTCPCQPCASGQVCSSTGQCIDPACMNITCSAGQMCVGGNCADDCANAVCPQGQTCVTGQCVPVGADGGGVDGSTGSDASSGYDAPMRGGPTDGAVQDGSVDGAHRADGGTTHTQSGPGCGCRVAGSSPAGGHAALPLLGLLALAGLALARRRDGRRAV